MKEEKNKRNLQLLELRLVLGEAGATNHLILTKEKLLIKGEEKKRLVRRKSKRDGKKKKKKKKEEKNKLSYPRLQKHNNYFRAGTSGQRESRVRGTMRSTHLDKIISHFIGGNTLGMPRSSLWHVPEKRVIHL